MCGLEPFPVEGFLHAPVALMLLERRATEMEKRYDEASLDGVVMTP